ncbi:DUF4199 domain-containing protein [Flavobacterium sp. CBA20B-1]|uniref:DUF4199 domain-containing protein n=1 Tax=Paenimyroides aestuarii TaxID=2968490 RepID=A0ABY5NRG3_9FLAO|nr:MULTISPECIES: DUF4199 domain-containing protein [Flavobacteriaceae]UUV21159.1 DUF4199 domain-containing protein [Paenimyroides aestuarii]WCM42608.1 DUF4199 domain-containing protein [Flavobacterium sp. CBA20B-1]
MNKIGIELKWAALITAFTCGWAALESALGYHKDFSNIIVTAFIYYVILTFLWAIAFIDKKKSLGKNAVWEFKSAFKFGLFLTGLLTLLSPISQYIIYENISPDYFENIINYQLSKGKQTRESLELIHNMNFTIRQGVMNALSLGVIYSALYAWVFKTKKQVINTPPTQTNFNKKKK